MRRAVGYVDIREDTQVWLWKLKGTNKDHTLANFHGFACDSILEEYVSYVEDNWTFGFLYKKKLVTCPLKDAGVIVAQLRRQGENELAEEAKAVIAEMFMWERRKRCGSKEKKPSKT